MILVKDGRIVDPKQGIDGIGDLLIEDGKIIRVGNREFWRDVDEETCGTVIDAGGMTVAPGFVDVHVHFRDPGQTYKEDIQTGARAAARGGYTTVVCMANTIPPVDNVETLEYVISEGKKTGIHVLSTAAVSKGLKGIELTDMEELAAHGAVGFTDDGIPLMNGKLVKEAMEEAKRLGLPLSFHEEDKSFIYNNGINRGAVSQELGIGGSPALAEDSLVARDCMIALATGAAVNIQHISSANSVKLVKLAKEMGANVTAEVTPHHFSLDERAVLTHGTLAKMNPPLRTTEDRKALLQGLKEGTIDMIATDHAPHSREEKEKPITEAPSGIIGLETALALGVTRLVTPGTLTMMELMEKMSLNPARLYHLDKGSLGEGDEADIVIFDENEMWTVENFASKSSNSPFLGATLCGKVKYTICGGNIVYEDKE